MIVKKCDTHGDLTIDMVYQQYSKYKEKAYPYFQCKKCVSDKKKRLYYANHEKSKAYSLLQRKKNYEKCIERDRKYKRKLLMDEGKYTELFDKQNGVCAICKNPETAKSHKNRTKNDNVVPGDIRRLSIDHCHESKKIRGLLCTKCNTALGLMKDSIANLKSAIDYLLSYSHEYVCEDPKGS